LDQDESSTLNHASDNKLSHTGINKQMSEIDHQKVWQPRLISILHQIMATPYRHQIMATPCRHQIMATPCRHPSKPNFDFDLSFKVAEKNYIILMHKCGGDLQKALNIQQGTPLQIGSEFWPVSIMAQIFSNHPRWTKMKSLLSNGSRWPLPLLNNHD
jgi:hypothetical protein